MPLKAILNSFIAAILSCILALGFKFIGVYLILLSYFASIFIIILGANIRPYSSLDSNRQIAQIGRLEPGEVIRFLSIRKKTT